MYVVYLSIHKDSMFNIRVMMLSKRTPNDSSQILTHSILSDLYFIFCSILHKIKVNEGLMDFGERSFYVILQILRLMKLLE